MESEITNCAKRAEQLNGHIRRAGINPNRWYMIAKASDVLDKPLGREIWHQTVVLFRTRDGAAARVRGPLRAPARAAQPRAHHR